MTPASDGTDPTVPIGSAIVETLKGAGPQSASALARRLQLRKADVLIACRMLVAAGQIRRLGKQWALCPPGRCEGLTKAGTRCARTAVSGSAFCTLHQHGANALVPGSEPTAHAQTGLFVPPEPEPTSLTPRPADNAPTATATGASVRPRDVAAARPEPTFEPERWLRPDGRPLTDADVIKELSMLGDEHVQAFLEGRLSKAEAYRLARNGLRASAQMGGPVYRSPFRS